MHLSRTGLIYDQRTNSHKSKRKHPQTPERAKSIMKLLTKKFYTTHPKVQFIQKIQRQVTDQHIRLAHPQLYIKHVSNLWPKTSHRSDLTVLDTYFNQKSQFCAKLAIGGVLQGIDKLMSGQWQNGFACLRPPGHHSGGRHSINGFCIYNNVAIGARYLLTHHKLNRVAIIDWDVHHGDGTQHIFQKEKNILLVSIHRYDRGTFYPAQQTADVRNQGLQSGLGSKINLPLNYVDQKFKNYPFQPPGDNEYIYLYHRIIEPALKKFNPDFILISCGFDAARGDPLGGFSVTPNGYYYLTKKLTQFQKPVLVVLEGGYNLNSISLSAEAVMKALLHEQSFPEEIDVPENQVKYKCQLPKEIHNQVDEMIEVLSKNWPCLVKDEQLLEYTKLIKGNEKRIFGKVDDYESSSSEQEEEEKNEKYSEESTQIQQKKPQSHSYNTRSKARAQKQAQDELKKKKKEAAEKQIQKKQQKQAEQRDDQDDSVVKQFYFAAGHLQKFKNFSPKNQKVTKITYPEEVNFYENQTFQKQFTPKYFGKEGEDSIVIENLLFGQEDPTVVDVKLSKQSHNTHLSQERRQKEKKKEQKSTTQQYSFRISGYTTPLLKEGGMLQKTDQSIKKILKFVVTLQNRALFIEFLTKLKQRLKESNRRYYGTSILLIKGPTKSSIKWVDFHYWYEENEGPDLQMIKGVENLHKFIEELVFQN